MERQAGRSPEPGSAAGPVLHFPFQGLLVLDASPFSRVQGKNQFVPSKR